MWTISAKAFLFFYRLLCGRRSQVYPKTMCTTREGEGLYII
ncbi:hypothetical protein BAE44_0016560 [Dichanthelium oligosanthes]|uniref:Uncharacterized protein n=1 Tax=Dichanthelium oligosanthes TaxID=888268 RepID=A0A1E5VB93_9POAL|nr:hypothetical protein BAE44_0016560 [Dichanthelium oligosanthes]